MFLIATVKRISRIDQSALTPFALALPICGRGYARRPTHRVFAGSAPADRKSKRRARAAASKGRLVRQSGRCGTGARNNVNTKCRPDTATYLL
jgi:hypothetical protein